MQVETTQEIQFHSHHYWQTIKSDITEFRRNYGQNYTYLWLMNLYTSKTNLKNNLYLSSK